MMFEDGFDTGGAISVAKGISEFGMMAIMSAFYLVITGIIMLFFVKWFVKVINGIIDRQDKMLNDIIAVQRDILSIVESIREGFRDETFHQAKQYGKALLDDNKYMLFFDLLRIREENNLENREEVAKKVHSVVENMYEARNSLFGLFSYNGKKLFHYTNIEWVGKVEQTCMNILYDKNFSYKKVINDLTLVYREILNEFYKRLDG
jgi:hypothetical protein